VGLAQVASDLMADRIRLVEAVVDRVWQVVPGYNSEHLSREELLTYVEGNVDLATAVLSRGQAPTREEFDRAIELGATRALQGIPLDSVIRAFRAGERTMLDKLLSHLSELDAEEVRSSVDLLVSTFDLLTQECITSYRQASDEMALHRERVEHHLVSNLALGEDPDAGHVEQQARLLGAAPAQPHRAIAVRCEAGSQPSTMLRVRNHVLSSLSGLVEGKVLFGTISGNGVLLVPGTLDDQLLVEGLGQALHERTLRDAAVVGVGTMAPSLRSVARSCHEAMATAEVLHCRRSARVACRWSDVLVDATLLQDRDLTANLVATRIGQLDEHEHLLKTLRTFLDCDLSQSRTARELFVHVNTVAYRLSRIRNITGKDPRRLPDAVEMSLALRASSLLA
jgi:sugar diacid utilization regulator